MKDKNEKSLDVGDVIKVRTIERPEVVWVGPVIAINSDTRGMLARTTGVCVEKAHFNSEDAELVHKASE